MVSEPVFAAVVAYAGTLTVILAGVLGWIVRRVWQLHAEKVPKIDERIGKLEQTLLGNPKAPDDAGHVGMTNDELEDIHERLDRLEGLIEEQQRTRQAEHEVAMKAIAGIAKAMKEEGFNGNVPDPERVEPDD